MAFPPTNNRPPRRLPAGLLAALALVLLVETFIARQANDLTSYQALGTRFALAQAIQTAPSCGVLGLGDSVMKFGFDPAEIERRLNIPAFNLAVPGTPPPLTHALLKRALQAGSRPSAIVIGHMTLSGHPNVHLDELSELLTPLEAAELASATHDFSLLNPLLTRRLVPSIRYRLPLRARILAALGGHPPVGDAPSALLRTWTQYRGMEPRASNRQYTGRMEPALERSVYSEPWHVLWVYEQYVRKIAQLAETHKIPIFWLIPPITPEAQSLREKLGLDAHHTKNLRAIQNRSPNLIILDTRQAAYPSSAFFDSCHLNTQGASTLTAAIAAAIAQHSTQQWVSLPQYSNPIAVSPHQESMHR